MDFDNYEWYKTGKVAVTLGSKEVIGIDTDWLKGGIKQGDVFIIDNVPYEIEEVLGSSSLSLVKEYTGESAGSKAYAIITRAKAVLLAELALALKQTVKNWNERETSYQEQFTELRKRTQIVDALGLYIDEDGDLAQGEQQSLTLFDALNVPIASQAETQEMLDEVFPHNH